VGVVVNQHRSRQDYDRSELEWALGEPLSAVLPFDPGACWRAVEHKRPVVVAERRSSLARSMISFAERLHGGQIELPRPKRPEPPAWTWPAWLGGKVP
jgi:Flp pilus assembly CpaE family ATPase